MNGFVALFLVVILPALIIGIPGFLLIRDMRREARGLGEFARSLRRMRDESRASGGDFKPTARAAKEMLGGQ